MSTLLCVEQQKAWALVSNDSHHLGSIGCVPKLRRDEKRCQLSKSCLFARLMSSYPISRNYFSSWKFKYGKFLFNNQNNFIELRWTTCKLASSCTRWQEILQPSHWRTWTYLRCLQHTTWHQQNRSTIVWGTAGVLIQAIFIEQSKRGFPTSANCQEFKRELSLRTDQTSLKLSVISC